jgi:hypothetical protein
MLAAAAVGGTASKLGGGKFANGAWTAAFVSRFNHDRRSTSPSLGANVCRQEGFTCTQRPAQEQLEYVASSKVVIGEANAESSALGVKVTEGACVLKRACVSMRREPMVLEANVDLYAVQMVQQVVVTYDTQYFGSYESSILTSRFVEVARGSPYLRPATVSEWLMPTRYPTRVDWSILAGRNIPESQLQRRSW